MKYAIGDVVNYKGEMWFIDNDESEFVKIEEPSYHLVPIEFSGDAYDAFFDSDYYDWETEWVLEHELEE